MFGRIFSVGGKRFHTGNIYGEALEECMEGYFWVDHWCSHFDNEAGTHWFVYGDLLK